MNLVLCCMRLWRLAKGVAIAMQKKLKNWCPTLDEDCDKYTLCELNYSVLLNCSMQCILGSLIEAQLQRCGLNKVYRYLIFPAVLYTSRYQSFAYNSR